MVPEDNLNSILVRKKKFTLGWKREKHGIFPGLSLAFCSVFFKLLTWSVSNSHKLS